MELLTAVGEWISPVLHQSATPHLTSVILRKNYEWLIIDQTREKEKKRKGGMVKEYGKERKGCGGFSVGILGSR